MRSKLSSKQMEVGAGVMASVCTAKAPLAALAWRVPVKPALTKASQAMASCTPTLPTTALGFALPGTVMLDCGVIAAAVPVLPKKASNRLFGNAADSSGATRVLALAPPAPAEALMATVVSTPLTSTRMAAACTALEKLQVVAAASVWERMRQ